MIILHYIILSSSYSTGRRIALHYPFEGSIDSERMHLILDRISDCYGGPDVSFGIHVTQTESESWQSVVESDPYFKDVHIIDTVEEFIELIQRDKTFTGLDASDYILSLTPCTHSRLEKLTYMCYADYLCDTGERLFEDEIYAFEHGPIIGSVYRRYGGQDESEEVIGEGSDIVLKPRYETLPIRSKLFFAANGRRKVTSIDRTLKRLEDVPTQAIVDMTHREGSPWSHVSRTGRYDPLPDDLILEYHRVERDVRWCVWHSPTSVPSSTKTIYCNTRYPGPCT
ncbi:MAG: DUF4065 domain-containing protein [Thermoplasmata archaeon]|nr:DUF4065 domain-containing protein [Thermoplasmata archaeon]